MDINSVKRDPTVIEEGTWVDDIPECGDLRLKVRGLNSRRVLSVRARKERSVPKEERDKRGQIKQETAERILSELLHEEILLDWDNITENGEPLLYNLELAAKWCTDENYRGFADAVTWCAQVVDKGYQETKEDLAKNLPSTSSGESDMEEAPTPSGKDTKK